MSNPAWLDDIFAGMMVAVAVYSAGRLVASQVWSRPIHRDVDVAHILMGSAMAGMLVSELNPIPVGVWELVFSGLAGWFVWRCYEFVREPGTTTRYGDHVHRLSRRLIHLVMAVAMLYMYLAAAPTRIGSGGSMAMGPANGTTADFALVPMTFILALLASGIWQLDATGRFTPSARPPLPVHGPVGDGSATHTGLRVAIETPASGAEEPALPWLSPRLEAGSHIIMCLTMAYMLVLML